MGDILNTSCNKAMRHPQRQNVNKLQNGVHQTQTSVIVHCGLLALEASKLSVIGNELQMTYFESKSLTEHFQEPGLSKV